MSTHGYHQEKDVLPTTFVVAQVHTQRRSTAIRCDATDRRHELLHVPWLQQSQQGTVLVTLRTEPKDRFDVTADHFDGPVVIGDDARDGDVVFRQWPRNVRASHFKCDETKFEPGQTPRPYGDIGSELLAVTLKKETDRLGVF